MKIGSQYLAYYDHYRDPKRMEAVRSKDWSPAEVTVSGRQQTRGFFEDYERGSGTAEEGSEIVVWCVGGRVE